MLFRTPAIALAVAVAAASPAHAQQSEPAARIDAYNDGIVAIMKQKLGFAARRDRFEALVREYYDMPAIASLVVGPKWSSSSAADRNAAITALTRHSAVSLAKNFVRYGGEKFIVDPAVVDRGTRKIVKVRISSPGGGGDTLLYVMRKGAGGWKIVDAVAHGVSQLAVQRADAAAAVAAGGAAGLARQLAKLDAAAK
jgi:phospholipid transport system substrate-binding protein